MHNPFSIFHQHHTPKAPWEEGSENNTHPHDFSLSEGGEFLDDAIRTKEQPVEEKEVKE